MALTLATLVAKCHTGAAASAATCATQRDASKGHSSLDSRTGNGFQSHLQWHTASLARISVQKAMENRSDS